MSTLDTVLKYVRLPDEITSFEHTYLGQMNKIGLVFFWLHLPVFVSIAALNGTGPGLAAGLTLALLVGPTVAWGTVTNPRHVSMVYGFTAMCMGGLLVHFGQGPVQIEMHFYFFSMLAVLAMFANPAVILTAAVTVTVHHLVVWALLPSSVFNYDAAFWVVGVHAVFVVLESVAACYISRSFFDNVIGLEKIVQQRTAELDARNQSMALILDNVDQGLLTICRDARIAPEHSAAVRRFLGPLPGSHSFQDYLAQSDEAAAEWFACGWELLLEDMMPMELSLSQLPAKLRRDGRHLSLGYIPLLDAEGAIEKVLVVVSDVTAEVEHRRVKADQEQILKLFERIMADRGGFLEFWGEADRLVEALFGMPDDGDLAVCKRWLHTLKGNTAIFGLDALSAHCHALETEIIEQAALPTRAQRAALMSRWETLRANLDRLLLDRRSKRIELADAEYDGILQAVLHQQPHDELAHQIRAWRMEPAQQRLERLAEQARGIAGRLGKPATEVVTRVGTDGLRLHPDTFSGFWQSFVHIIRNAIDHGVSAESGSLSLEIALEDADLVVTASDDGRGIGWEAIRARADAMGLPSETPADLQAALFCDGVSSRDTVSEFSGRGVGLGATREACAALGGDVQVVTAPGEGTTFRFRFPLHALQGVVWSPHTVRSAA